RWRDRLGIAQRLRCHPVLAVRAVQVASQHPETVSQRARVDVEEGLLLNRVTLHSADVSPGDVQFPTLVVTDLANARLPFGNRAAVTAGEAANPIPFNGLVQLAFTDMLIQNFTERRQLNLCLYFRAGKASLSRVGRLSDVMGVKPLLGMPLLGGRLSGSEVSSAAHDNGGTGLIAASLRQQGPEIGFSVVLGAASAAPKRSGNFRLRANVASFGSLQKPLPRLGIIFLHTVSVGVTHRQRVFRTYIAATSKFLEVSEAERA